MLPRLGHRPVRSGNNQDGTIHLGCPGDHVLHVVGVSGTINVRVVPVFGLVFDVGGRNGDSALLFFRGGIDFVVSLDITASHFLRKDHCDRCGESGLSMVNVADRTDIHVRLGPFKLFFGHLIACCGSFVRFAQKLMAGIEPATSSLPRTRSTPELHERGMFAHRDVWTVHPPERNYSCPVGGIDQRRQKRRGN